ncbi:hypothetical protein TNCV_1674241 [Trichonephila clavipes]|nr:hypothetical protein TNCV_1674241 [Trichonephila clavipes]
MAIGYGPGEFEPRSSDFKNIRADALFSLLPQQPRGHGHGLMTGMSSLVLLKTFHVNGLIHVKPVETQSSPVNVL